MMLSIFLAMAAVAAQADHYAVLVAGSSGYYNYRHQADVCHAYQIMVRNGISPDNIITMSYDDVAGSYENPFPGKLFNKPTDAGTPGVDVYEGCKIDYKGSDVTPDNFIKVLKGDSSAGGKVLTSGSDDRVFINFVDHGAVGLIAFPVGELYADDLMSALTYMHKNKMYKELVFYLEACESGSMFQGKLPSDIKIFATTAANAQESSWGTYCPPNDKVDGKELNTCLGDLYSVNWMEDADLGKSTETLEQQYETVKKETSLSHVTKFGEMDMSTDLADEFIGASTSEPAEATAELANADAIKTMSAVDSRDIALVTFFHQYLNSGDDITDRVKASKRLITEIEMRTFADKTFHDIAGKIEMLNGNFSHKEVLESTYLPTQFDCQRSAVESYKSFCGPLTDYALKHVRILVNMCEITKSTKSVQQAVYQTCVKN